MIGRTDRLANERPVFWRETTWTYVLTLWSQKKLTLGTNRNLLWFEWRCRWFWMRAIGTSDTVASKLSCTVIVNNMVDSNPIFSSPSFTCNYFQWITNCWANIRMQSGNLKSCALFWCQMGKKYFDSIFTYLAVITVI